MVRVKFFGLLRLDTGTKEVQVEADNVKSLFPAIAEEMRRQNPGLPIRVKDLEGCIVLVNGQPCGKHQTLQDGDEVFLMTPSAGG